MDQLNPYKLHYTSKNGSTNTKEREKRLTSTSMKFMLWFATALGGIEIVCFFLVWCFLFRNNADKQAYVLAAETGFRKFSYSELKQATKGFSQEIGRGAGGIVYKGVLSDDKDLKQKFSNIME